MKNIKKIVTLGAVALGICATTITAFAASNYNTPAEAVAGLTGRTVDSVISERSEQGKTYGTIANEAGKLTEFKSEVLEMKKDSLAKKVADGTITQERADSIITQVENNQENCDGTGYGKNGSGMGMGIGSGMGNGSGAMKGNGQGRSRGQGNCGVYGNVQ